MLNPDKYIRKAYVDALSSATGLNVWNKGIPKDVEVLPDTYIILRSQTKQRTSVSKQLWEWQSQITIDIVSVNELGYNSTVVVDNIEQTVMNTIESGLTFGGGFNNKSTRFIDSVPLDIDTPTNTINRKVVIYEHWLNKVV